MHFIKFIQEFLDKLDNFSETNYKKIKKQKQNVVNAICSAENSTEKSLSSQKNINPSLLLTFFYQWINLSRFSLITVDSMIVYCNLYKVFLSYVV